MRNCFNLATADHLDQAPLLKVRDRLTAVVAEALAPIRRHRLQGTRTTLTRHPC